MATVPVTSFVPQPNQVVPNAVLDTVGGDAINGEMYRDPELRDGALADATVAALKNAHDDYRTGLAKTRSALRTKDPSLTPEAHYIEVERRFHKWMNGAVERSDTARQSASRALEAIDADTVRRLDIGEGGRNTNEIRAHFKSLKKNERTTALHAAIARFDKETLAAVLTGPIYLSGFATEAEREGIRAAYVSKHAADLVERKRIIKKALDVNAKAFDQLLDASGVLFPKKLIDGIMAGVNAGQAARDAIWGP